MLGVDVYALWEHVGFLLQKRSAGRLPYDTCNGYWDWVSVGAETLALILDRRSAEQMIGTWTARKQK